MNTTVGRVIITTVMGEEGQRNTNQINIYFFLAGFKTDTKNVLVRVEQLLKNLEVEY